MPAGSSLICFVEPASIAWRRDQGTIRRTNETNLQEFLTSKYHQRPGRDDPSGSFCVWATDALAKGQRAPFRVNVGFGRSRFPCHRLHGKLRRTIQLRRMAGLSAIVVAIQMRSARSRSSSQTAFAVVEETRSVSEPIVSTVSARAAALVFDATRTPDAAARGTESEESCSV